LEGEKAMIYLELFLTFLQIGAFSFGGGYGMISLIREKILMYGWFTEEEILNMIAVAESTPGPIAVNMATFVGSAQGGFLGALLATLGVVLPSFILILLIAALMRNMLKYSGVQAFLGGIRPCIVGLILATAITMLMSTSIGIRGIGDTLAIDVKGIIIFAILIAITVVTKLAFKKKMSPILMIVLSAGLGMLMYSF
jgi:chromate transporter